VALVNILSEYFYFLHETCLPPASGGRRLSLERLKDAVRKAAIAARRFTQHGEPSIDLQSEIHEKLLALVGELAGFLQ
jgi:hypothetical protein